MSDGGCKLITIPISHYCDKARWALDRAGIPFEERAHLQVLHWLPVKRAGGKMTAPVLVCGDTVLNESADIVAWADRQADLGLYPDDEVRALEREYDERLGPHGRRWMYDAMGGRRDLVLRYAPTGVPSWQRRMLPVAWPVASRVISRYLDIDDDTSAESLRIVRELYDEVGERLSDGRAFLCGDAFTAADLTFAALSAPMVMPREYGVPLPESSELPAPMAGVVEEMRAHPAGQFALDMYARERRSAQRP